MKTFEEQVEENKTINGKPISEHPMYPFNEAYTAKELVESHLFMAIRSARAGQGILTLEDITRIFKESFEPEELAFICKKLLIRES
jgi:hypothetical protein